MPPWINTLKTFNFSQLIRLKKMCLPPKPKLFRRIRTLILTNSMIHFKDKRFFHRLKVQLYSLNAVVFLSISPTVICLLSLDLSFLTHPHGSSVFLDLLTICSLLFVNRTNRIFLTRLKIFINKLYDMKSSTQQTHKIFLTSLSPLKIIESFWNHTQRKPHLHPSSTHPYNLLYHTYYTIKSNPLFSITLNS
jgi:hypothetical protein